MEPEFPVRLLRVHHHPLSSQDRQETFPSLVPSVLFPSLSTAIAHERGQGGIQLLLVDGLQREHIDDSRAYTVFFKRYRRLKGFMHHNAAGDYRHVSSFTYDDALADIEMRALLIYGIGFLPPAADIFYSGDIDALRKNIVKEKIR